MCFADYRIVDIKPGERVPFEEVSVQEKIAEETLYIEENKLEQLKSQSGALLEVHPHRLGYNCVRYVKSKRPLPRPLSTLSDKTAIINSSEPEVGAVAITPESWFGHLSLVLEVREDTLVIEEGNYIGGYRTVRVISRDFPIGYYL